MINGCCGCLEKLLYYAEVNNLLIIFGCNLAQTIGNERDLLSFLLVHIL